MKMNFLALLFFACFLTCLTQYSFAGVHGRQPTNHKGKVVYTTDSGGLSYIKYEEKESESWVAVMQTDVKVGDIIVFQDLPPKTIYQLKPMNMIFDKIIFALEIKITHRDIAVQDNPELSFGR